MPKRDPFDYDVTRDRDRVYTVRAYSNQPPTLREPNSPPHNASPMIITVNLDTGSATNHSPHLLPEGADPQAVLTGAIEAARAYEAAITEPEM